MSLFTSLKYTGTMTASRIFLTQSLLVEQTLPSPKEGLVCLSMMQPKKSSKGSLLSGYEWDVKDADNDAIDALQVELSCTAGTLDISYVVSLHPLSIATAVIVKNNGRKDASLTSAILSHLSFKKRSRTAINGLRGCSYCTLSSPFELLSPSKAMKTKSSGWFGSDNEDKAGVWTKQDVPITILNDKLSRAYAAPPPERQKPYFETPPSNYETLDQGRELFFRIIRMGFEVIHKEPQ
ncbi:Photosynthetic NDH subunit of subcomplex B 2 [Hibiscus syriacus]|uniref:Photosynthetic NDH subunit of subcomplex B 2 n=1 Tax=Hibiscus syriacus TaxID=106335 RepID=A0A6A3CZW2_HIBSY|nr:Photosynthetic NDH subunit of subcomplex B 2 [Hibiscus syriacus]